MRPANIQKLPETVCAERDRTILAKDMGKPAAQLELALFPQCLHGIGQAPQIDKTGSVGLVIVALLECHQLLGIQALRRRDGGGNNIA